MPSPLKMPSLGRKPSKTGNSADAQEPSSAAAATSPDVGEAALVDLSVGEAPAGPRAPPAEPSSPSQRQNLLDSQPDFAAEGGKPKAGFTTAGLQAQGLQLFDGEGEGFELRVGPDYKKHGKKAPSAAHIYHPITIDIFKRKKVAFHVASKLTLPPPPDGAGTPNPTGLPRRIVVCGILPADAPPMFGGGADGSCYQVVVVFGATAEALAQWQAAGSPACKLFSKFVANCPEGVLPESGDTDIKERLKLLPRLDNMDKLGLPGWIAGYNGKPALITKSGAVYRGDDYMEVDMNTFRFGFLTKKGVNYLFPRFGEFDFHAALTMEGREDDELPEQTLLATRIRGLDVVKLASDYDIDP